MHARLKIPHAPHFAVPLLSVRRQLGRSWTSARGHTRSPRGSRQADFVHVVQLCLQGVRTCSLALKLPLKEFHAINKCSNLRVGRLDILCDVNDGTHTAHPAPAGTARTEGTFLGTVTPHQQWHVGIVGKIYTSPCKHTTPTGPWPRPGRAPGSARRPGGRLPAESPLVTPPGYHPFWLIIC